MVELALIGATGLLSLGFAAWLVRWVLARPSLSEAAAVRLATAVRIASERFSRRLSGVIGALVALLGGAIFLAYGLYAGTRDTVAPLRLGVWLTVSLLLGGGGALAAARFATFMGARAPLRVAAGARRSVDLALQIAMRGGAAVGLATEALATLLLGLLAFGALFEASGFGAELARGLASVPHLPLLLSGYALGACFAALLLQFGGAAFAKAADVGADVAAREHALADDVEANPALVADLAGDAAGDLAARAGSAFASTAAESLALMYVGVAVYEHNASLPSALALVLLPLIARGFGLLGTAFGAMVVRTDDREDPWSAVRRGAIVATAMHATGIAGTAKWILGASWLPLVGCSLVGAAVGAVLGPLARQVVEPRMRFGRDLSEAARAGASLAVLGGFALALDALIPILACAGVGLVAAYALGASTELVGGGAFGVGLALVGLAGTSSYALTVESAAAFIDGAGGLVEVGLGRDRPDVRGRTLLLDAIGTTAKGVASVRGGVLAALASILLGVVAAQAASSRTSSFGPWPEPGVFDGVAPAPWLAAGVAVSCAAFLVARALGGVARASRRIVDEVRRQLGDPPRPARDDGRPVRPDYDVCTEIAARFALRNVVPPSIVVALVPILVGLVLRLPGNEAKAGSASDAVSAFLAAAAVVCVPGALLAGVAGAAFGHAKKYVVTGAHGGRTLVDESGARAENPTYHAVVVGDTVGDPLSSVAAPTLAILARLLPVLTLVLLPFIDP
jgi:K(+)-stimulated pyrophosphate-energized sodium pump